MNHSHDHDPVEQMNRHRRDELVAIARTLGGTPDATDATAERVDATGVEITITSPRDTTLGRIEFLEPVSDFPNGIRIAFVRLARHAQNTLDETPPPSRGTTLS